MRKLLLMTRFITIMICLLVLAPIHAQLLMKRQLSEQAIIQLKDSLNKKIDDSTRLTVLLKLAANSLYKLDRSAVEVADFENGFIFINKAKEVNFRLGSIRSDGIISLYESILTRKKGSKTTGKQFADRAINQFQVVHDEYNLALAYLELSRYYNSNNPEEAATITSLNKTLFEGATKRVNRNQLDSLLYDLVTFYIARMRLDSRPSKLDYLNHILVFCRMRNDKLLEFWARKEVADIHYQQGRLGDAINELLLIAKEQKEGKYERICWTYDLLSGLYGAARNYEKALYYALETLKNINTPMDSTGLNVFYARVASHYSTTGSPSEAIQWNLKRLNLLIATNNTYGSYTLIHRITSDLILLGRFKEALQLILDKTKVIVPLGNADKRSMLLSLAQCYSSLNNNAMAEKYCEELIKLYELRIKLKEIPDDTVVDQFLASFYLKIGQNGKAEMYFDRALAGAADKSNASTSSYARGFLFKLDSAKGNFLSAIKHLQAFQKIKDSIFTVAKSKQIEEIKIAYATEQKEQEVRWLTKQGELQKSELRQGITIRNITFAVVALLIIIVALLYNRYRLKQKNNKKLEMQQMAIREQNVTLRHLVNEKDWLVKEIHHRVKNNLQIVMSLLNSQSVYIDNEPALAAIHDSQHRVHAMSLIHQKLYNSENVSSIDMSLYIRELISYLSDSFNTGQQIYFELNIEPLAMDVSQAVPLGLILNEAITNSIKYAFPGRKDAVISISLKNTSSHHYLLTISDNGVGIPGKLSNKKTGSLGMSLMEGLSQDLDGHFSIENNKGTTITISFVHDMNVKRPTTLTESLDTNN